MKTTKIQRQILDNFSAAPELQKAVSDELQKAIYVDNRKNRKLGRVGKEYRPKKANVPTANVKATTGTWAKTIIAQYGGAKSVPKRIQQDVKDMVSGLGKDITKVSQEYRTVTGKNLNLKDPKISQALLNGGKTDAIGKTLSGLKSYQKLRNSINEIHSYLTDDMEDGWDD